METEDYKVQIATAYEKIWKLEDTTTSLNLQMQSAMRGQTHAEGNLAELKRDHHRVLMMREDNISEIMKLLDDINTLEEKIKDYKSEVTDLQEEMGKVRILEEEKE